MNLLLDTHAFFWFAVAEPRLPHHALAAITSTENAISVSVVTGWEMSLKAHRGRWPQAKTILPELRTTIEDIGANVADIRLEHGILAGALAVEHRDPFDRMLAAQAITDDMVLVTADPAFSSFPVRTLWTDGA